MAENTFDGWIIIDDTHYQDAKTGEIKEIVRDSLRLDRIDQNGTIQEMLDTIDSNFMEIARHGGGPAGIDGTDGEAGADGSNVEYIYCRADEMKIGVQYPDTVEGIKGLFINIENSAITDASGNKYVNYPSNSNPRVKWFDHAQGVTREFKNEYALIRVKRGDTWYYPSEPVLWAHWGETGRDGDGVEYIFLLSNKSTTEDPGILTSVKKIGEMTAAQEAIYNIDDFYPGKNWFNEANMDAARKALKAAGAEMTESEFENRWRSYFGFCDGGYDWTDEPIGTDPLHIYEYVSIRKSTTDENDKKTWGNFSEPALWSNYSLPSRTFIIYNNLIDTQTPTKIDNGKGWWDTTTDKLIFNKSGYELPSGWTDENTEPEDNEITWMCSGIFKNTGENVYWSKPMRITGRDGKQGEDGTTIEFIYNLSNTEPSYPDNDEDRKTLFDNVEEYHEYEGWMDHPLSISPEQHTEYVAIRSRESESSPWEYSPAPILWAHWGEDGTDGDGVEYIFKLSKTSTCTPVKSQSAMTGEIGKYAKIIFQMDDFYPDEDWFTVKHKNKAIEAVIEAKKTDNTLDENYITNNWESLSAYLDQNWVDNPQGTGPDDPYEFVSIRRCDPDADTRVWTDFSEPALWSYYGKRTRTFIVYCNVPEAKVNLIKSPSGGWWDITNDTLQKSKNDASDYESDALTDMSGISGANVGVWQDDNNDVRGMITFMASGIFEEPGNLLKWSEPNRVTGATGEKGADGADIEFIYALEDRPVYPTTDTDKHILFEGVENADPDPITGFKSFVWPQDPNATKKTTWFDNAQAISKRTPTEYCWSRERKTNNNPIVNGGWTYTEKPFLWAHWGEDGTDGDGIEYIFHRNNDNSLDTNLYPNVTDSEYQDYIDLLYTMNDFYPGEGWFNISGISADFKALAEEAGLDVSDWDTKWSQLKSKMKKGWTDNPQGTGPSDPYELVSIRKSHNDSNGKRVWEPFSEPVVWSTYSTSTRVFIIYCNMIDESTPGAPEGGWWNIEDEDGDIRNEDDHSEAYKYEALTETQRDNINNSNNYSADEKKIIGYWMDTNEDDIVDNSIVWMSSGVFSNDGTCLGWSEPHRITGADGRPGADGSNIQFIYALSDTIPAYPSTNKSLFFDSIEDPDHSSLETFPSEEEAHGDMYICTDDDGFKYVNYRGTHWYDRAQVISPDNPTEYCASRRLPAGATGDNWVYDTAPFVWAHWGEDGTDGDGIEYIFMLTSVPTTFNDWEDYMVIPDNDTARTIYSMSDFRPNGEWFIRLKNETDTEPINMTKVKTEMRKNEMTFDLTDWNDMKAKFSFETASGSRPVIGTWTDNPGELSTTNQYQYVSIRREIDNVWEPFEKPVLWSKYYITRFTAFVFTTTVPDINLTGAVPVGWNNDFDNPKPINLLQGGQSISVTWSDNPEIDVNTGKTMVWMTSAQFIEGKTESTNPVYPKWSSLKRMADTNEFQVEWSSADLSNEQLTDLNNKMNEAGYNFKDILKDSQVNYNHDVAEQTWRNLVIAYTKNNQTYAPYNAEGVKFYDDVDNAVLMATCQMSNGEWTNWSIKRVKGEKGEKGEPGTSIKIQRRISYEIPLANANDTYNYSNASNAQENFTYDPAPKNNNLAIVYPASETEGVYIGDKTTPDKGGCLYMWKYNETTGEWEDYNDYRTNGEIEGNTYISPNKHLILWDGDSWQDLGEFEGPEGKRWILVVKYAKDSSSGKQFCTNTDPDAKWIGTLTYLDNGTNRDAQLDDETFINTPEQQNEIVGWNWQVFKGQDGYGYEYIFKTTNTPTPPHIPNKNSAWHTIANIEPGRTQNPGPNDAGWYDEPMEPTKNSKYVWMCWRKFDRSAGTNGEWTDFAGKGDTTNARLWQVYANSIVDVNEVFHADSSLNPTEAGFTENYGTDAFNNYWKSKDTVCPSNNTGGSTNNNVWGRQNKYLFNREIIQYTNSDIVALPAHLVGTWDSGIIGIQDYYCVHTSGENAPAMNGRTPETSSGTEGKTRWTTTASKAVMDTTYKYLWNISKRTYSGNKQEDWSEPIVIGVYGKGENGVDRIYADLDNEMDTIQINTNKEVLNVISGSKYISNLHLYKGADVLKFNKCEVSGETGLTGDKFKLYYKSDESSQTWSQYTRGTTITAGIEVIKMEISLAVGDTIPEYSNINFILTNTGDQIVRSVTYTLIGTTNPSTFSIVPSDSILVERTSGNTTTIVPGSISVDVVEYIGGIPYPRTSNRTGVDGGFILKKCLNGDYTNEETVTNYSSIITTGLSAGDRLTFRLHADTPNTNTPDDDTTPDIVMDTETIFVLKEGTNGENGTGYQYKYVRFDSENSTSGYTNDCSLTNPGSDTPTFKFGTVSVSNSDVTSYAQGVNSRYTFEYRSERFGNPIDGWGTGWTNPVCIARNLEFDPTSLTPQIQDIVEQQTSGLEDDIKNAIVGDLDGQYALAGDFDQLSLAVTKMNADSKNHFATLENSVANATLATDKDGYLIVDKPEYSIWFGKNYTPSDPDERRNVCWTLFKCTEVSISDNGGDPITTEYTSQSLTPVISNNEDYYNDNKTKIIIVLQKYVETDIKESFLSDTNTTVLKYYLNSEPNSVFDGRTISIKVKNNNSGEFKLFINGVERDALTYEDGEISSQFDRVFRIDDNNVAVPESPTYARLLIWTVLDLVEDNDSNNGYTSEDGDWLKYNNSLSWNVGVSEIYGELLDGGSYNLAYSKTASVFEKPIVKSTNGYDDVFGHIDIFKQFGYPLIKDNNGVVIEAETNGKLSAIVADSNPTMRFIPGNTSFENLVSIINGDLSSYPTTINDLPVGTTTSYYLASKSESAVTDLPYTYDMFLTDSPGNGDNTFSFTNVSSFENQHRFAENSGSALDNKNNWCKCTVDTGTGYEIYVNQNNLATKISINVTANTTYTFSLYTYSENNWDGIMISTNGGLTSSDIKLGTSGNYIASETSGYIGHCTGKGTTKTVTYPSPSSGTIYVYFRTESSGIENYNSTGCSYGKVVITPAITELFTDITSGTYNGYRQYTNTSVNNADDKEYVMDITSPYDDVVLNLNGTYSIISGGDPAYLKIYVYHRSSGASYAQTLIFNSDENASGSINITKSLFDTVINPSNFKLYFKIHIEYSSNTLSSLNIRYKFTTKNKITSDIVTSSVNTGETYSIGLNEENYSGTIIASPITEYILGSENQSSGYSFITNDFEFDKSVKSHFRQEDVVDVTVSMFTISSTIKDTQATLTFNVEQSSLKNNVQYMIIPAYFDNNTLDDINADADYCHFVDETDFFHNGFVNNAKYNTVGKTWLSIPSNNTVTIDFNTAYRYYNPDPMGVNEDLNNKYFFTVIQKVTSWTTSEQYLTTFVTYNVTNTNFFSTTSDSQSRSSDSYNSYGFMLDRVMATVNDRSVHLNLIPSRSQAKDSLGNPTNNYNDVRDEDKPYLIPTVTELATISQMVNDGIASTSIVVGVGEHAAAQVFQATEDGSSIWMEADEVGIRSTHFNLDKSGVTMMGDLYATDTEGNITAGVIGTDTSASNDVKFFAGTKIPKVNDSYQNIKNYISDAPFKVYEDGSIILESKGGKTRIGSDGVLYASGAVIDGNIRAKEFVAENEETMNIESDIIDPAAYSGTITKTTIIDGSTFSIMANGAIYDDGGGSYNINNGIYIKIVDDLLNDVQNSVIEDEHLIGVPVLCMRYKGVEYVLSPASWKINAATSADITNMYWNNVYNTQNVQIVQYTFNNPSNNYNNSRYYASSTYNSNCTFYLFGYKQFISIIDSSPVLYQFTVRDWGDSSNINTKLNLLYNKKLISSNESTSSYGGAYTLYVPSAPLTYESKNVSNYSGGGLMIDETGCNIYNKFLYNNLSFGDHIHIYYLINQGYSGGQGWEEHIYSGNGGHNVTSDITSSTCKNTQNKWGDKKIINIIKNLLLAEDDINAGPLTCHWNTCVFGDGNFNDTGIVGGEFENYFPFDKNFDNYGSYYQPYGLFKAEIDCYPMLNISNYGKTKATTTNLIWTHVLYEIDTSYGYKGTLERRFSITNDNNTGSIYNFSPSKIKFRVEFDLVFDFGTSSISNSESNILNYVNTFLNSNSLYSLIQSGGFREFSFEGVITDNNYNNNDDTVIIKTKAWLDYLSNY